MIEAVLSQIALTAGGIAIVILIFASILVGLMAAAWVSWVAGKRRRGR